ncbi:hypothetical protein HDV00_007021 [Rhizophlyctis rosea]|nr:hypothetical protein HDV00_007021 [Rhizophlyctis rosea]
MSSPMDKNSMSNGNLPTPHNISKTAAVRPPHPRLRQLSLVVLVVQNTSLVLLMRYTRTNHDANVPMYSAAGAVLVMEIVKLVLCTAAIFYEHGNASVGLIKSQVESRETLKMIIPSGIYAVQNNLLYTALTNLDAATYQVTYQIKILTTALFSVLLLKRSLGKLKWGALVLLLVGVAMVQLQSEPAKPKAAVASAVATSSAPRSVNPSAIPTAPRRRSEIDEQPSVPQAQPQPLPQPDAQPEAQPQPQPQAQPQPQPDPQSSSSTSSHPIDQPPPHHSTPPPQNRYLGLTAVLLSAISSGFAGCYFEAILKAPYQSSMTPTTSHPPLSSISSLFLRNIQLGLPATLFSLITLAVSDPIHLSPHKFFEGYGFLTWCVIMNQALGGLLVSLVVKYADSILKGFATSVSIVASSVVASVWMGFVPTAGFVAGSGIVLGAVYLYSL